LQKIHKIVSEIEKESILSLAERGKRIDRRGLEDFREVSIEVGVVEKAEGSAYVTLGDTKIMAGVKVEIGEPFSDTPNKGVFTVNAEFVPLASPLFEPGPPDEDAIELARVVDRGIRESEAIDLEKLCLIPGEKVWIIFIDIYILDHAGNLFDASALSAISALLNTKIPEVKIEDGEIKVLDKWVPLPVRKIPVSVTFAKIDDKLIVDPCIEEENVMNARLTITMDEEDNVVAIQKGGVGTLKLEDVYKAIEIAKVKTKEFREKIPRGDSNG